MKCPKCDCDDVLIQADSARCLKCGDIRGGVWMAYYQDKSAPVPFGTEVEALRHAVEHSMTARFVPFGETL